MGDTFEKLIADMRAWAEVNGDPGEAFVNFADRLEALVGELDPYLLPAYGERHTGDDPPIFTELMRQQYRDPATKPDMPGSDWALVEPVKPRVTGNGSDPGES